MLAIYLGFHAGSASVYTTLFVSRTRPVSSAFAMKISTFASTVASKAILRPSGDHAGLAPPLPKLVRSLRSEPSDLTVAIPAKKPVKVEKAIREPSGDHVTSLLQQSAG